MKISLDSSSQMNFLEIKFPRHLFFLLAIAHLFMSNYLCVCNLDVHSMGNNFSVSGNLLYCNKKWEKMRRYVMCKRIVRESRMINGLKRAFFGWAWKWIIAFLINSLDAEKVSRWNVEETLDFNLKTIINFPALALYFSCYFCSRKAWSFLFKS